MKTKAVILIFAASFLMLFPLFSTAGGIHIPNPLHFETFDELISAILDFLLSVGLVVVPIVFIYAAFIYLTAGGSPDKIQTANRALVWSAVGLALILIANGVVSIITDIMGIETPDS